MWDINGRFVRQAPGVRPPFLDDDALETLHAVTPKGVPFQVNLRTGVVRQGSVSLPLEQLSCFARSGQYVYTVRDKTRIQRWSIATGRYEGAFRDVGVKVSSLAPSKDDARLIAGLETGEIAVCKVGATVDVSILRGHRGPVRALCPGPRPGLFVSGADDCTLRIWDIASIGLIHVLEGHSSPIRAVHFSPTGVMVAGGASDGSVRLWGLDWAPKPEAENS
jgi:WD40 repeat protein